jgi:two-component system response regulator
LVLLDLHMPEMGGIETLNAMRADRALRALPVIVFSSSERPHHVDQAYASGANAYLVKAGDFGELVRHLRGMTAFWLQAARLPGVPPAVPGDVS